jgi:hypothetical protein
MEMQVDFLGEKFVISLETDEDLHILYQRRLIGL